MRWSSALERLEERMLCAADVDVALIDRTLPDPAALVRALQPGGKVFLYDGQNESAEQILSRVTDWAERTGNRLRSISLMSHGAAGRFALGNDWITKSSLDETRDEWQRLGKVLADDASINLFGCNLIAGADDGKVLINRLSKLVGATVFASTDLTGRGGDWVLEATSRTARSARSGIAISPHPFSVKKLSRWAGSLASPLDSESLVNTTTTNTQRTHEGAQAVATDANGNFVIVWSGNGTGDADGIFAQRYNALGVRQGSEFRVNTTTTGVQTAPAIAMDADGDFVVVWSGQGTGDTTGIFAQRYNATGVAQGGEFRVNATTANNQTSPSVAMDDTGRFVISWTSDGAQDGEGKGIYARRYNAAGTALSGEFLVNFVTTNDDQDYSHVAMDANGDFVIVWASQINTLFGWGIAGQRFDSTGAAVLTGPDSEFIINTTFAGDQQFPSVAMTSAGAFVVAWQSSGQDGSGQGVYARVYNATGGAVTGEFRVNGLAVNDQQYPSVAMDDAGNFTVTWQSASQDGDGWGVLARDYNAAGVVQGGEYLVNGVTTANQQMASIAMDVNGDFVVAWSGNGSGDGDGVFIQRFRSVSAGYTISQTSGHTTTEAGGTATYTIRLNHQPTSNVTLTLGSSDTTEGIITSPTTITFTPANWNVAQMVEITGVNDFLDDGNVAYEITATASGTDAAYNGLAAADVQVANTDDDTAGVSVSAASGNTTEAGSTATFTVVLNSQPLDDVTITLVSSNTGEGTIAVGSLTFTPGNWNVAQTVTVTGVNDFRDDGNVGYQIQTGAASSADPAYNGMTVADVSLSNTDDDTFGITVSPTSGLTTTEANGTATFTVVLNSQPSANVVINLSSSDTGEGTLSAGTLTFTPANWNVEQLITVTGVNDTIDDGDAGYTIVSAAAVSGDGQYNGLNPADVAVTNTDNDTAGFEIEWITAPTTTEAGGTAQFRIRLAAEPTSAVVISIDTQDSTEGSATPNVYSLNTSNWNDWRIITVTGIDDALLDGNVGYVLRISASSSDGAYDGLEQDLTVTNLDNDTPGITVSQTSLMVTEAGGSATFTVVLDAAPTQDVIINLFSEDESEATLSVTSLLFTPANWSTPQTVTVTGVNDFIDDGDAQFDIVLSPAQSADANYDGLDPDDVAVTNEDNDTFGITVNPVGGLVTTEAGGTGSYTIVLDSQPLANVVIGIVTDDATEGQVSVTSLTFTPANWNVPQTVTITGVNDSANDGDVSFVVRNQAAQSTDPNYAGLNPANVSVTNEDDDDGRLLITPTMGLETTESGGTTTFSVRLDSAPTADVLVQLLSSDEGEGTLSVTTLTFTSVNWNVAQTVTITGVADGIADGDATYSISFTTTSADANFDGLAVADLSVVNRDTTVAAPSITTSAGARQVIEDEGQRSIDPDLTVADANGILSGATIRITANYVRGEDRLAFTNVNGIAGAWNATSGTLTLTGSATVAQYQAALRSVTYENTSDSPDTAPRTIRFTVTDGGASASASKSLIVEAVNDAPEGAAESYDVSADGLLNVSVANGVLDNDEDVDNASDELSALLVTPPTLGRLTLNADGSFTYVPNDGVEGTDTFVYQTSDGTDSGEPVTVTIDVSPAEPPPPPGDPEPEPEPEPPPVEEPEEPARPEKPDRPDRKPPRETPRPTRPDSAGSPGSISAPEKPAQPPARIQAPSLARDHAPIMLTRAGYVEAATIDYGHETVIIEATPGNPEPTMINFPTLPKWEVAQTLSHSLDQLGDQLAAETQTANTAAAVVGSAALVWVGYVVYTLRGGALLLTFLTSMPLWRTLDPLPVLEASEARAARKKNKRKKDSDQEDPDERNLRTVLGS